MHAENLRETVAMFFPFLAAQFYCVLYSTHCLSSLTNSSSLSCRFTGPIQSGFVIQIHLLCSI